MKKISFILLSFVLVLNLVEMQRGTHFDGLTVPSLKFLRTAIAADAESSGGGQSSCNGSLCSDGHNSNGSQIHYGDLNLDGYNHTCCGLVASTSGKKGS